LRAAGLGKMAGLEGGALGQLDVRGYPAALTAALGCVGDAACAAATGAAAAAAAATVGQQKGTKGVEGMDVDVDGGEGGGQEEVAWGGVEGLVEAALHAAGAPVDGAEGSVEAHHSVSRAVAAVLATDAPLRRAVAQGLAMLAFAPVAAALAAAPSAAASPAAAGAGAAKLGNSAAATTSNNAQPQQQKQQQLGGGTPGGKHGSEVVHVLLGGVLARVCSAAHAAAKLCANQQAVALADDIVSMGLLGGSAQGGEDDDAATGTHTPSTAADAGVGSGQLLPARFMASPACRHLQEGLMALQDVHSLRSQAGLLAVAGQIVAGVRMCVFCVLCVCVCVWVCGCVGVCVCGWVGGCVLSVCVGGCVGVGGWVGVNCDCGRCGVILWMCRVRVCVSTHVYLDSIA